MSGRNNTEPAAFVCQRCGHCCQGEGGIIMSLFDQQRLAAHLGISPEELLDRYCEQKDGRICLIAGDDGYCVFYQEGCSVHPGRPNICRAWPFFRGNLVDPYSFEMIKDYCPGVNKDIPHSEFKKQGLAYLRSENLVGTGPDSAGALILDMEDDPAE